MQYNFCPISIQDTVVVHLVWNRSLWPLKSRWTRRLFAHNNIILYSPLKAPCGLGVTVGLHSALVDFGMGNVSVRLTRVRRVVTALWWPRCDYRFVITMLRLTFLHHRVHLPQTHYTNVRRKRRWRPTRFAYMSTINITRCVGYACCFLSKYFSF